MSNSLPENSVERRRKVLKGALAASGVVTMGYSGSALASFNCIEKTILQAPSAGRQLVEEVPSDNPGWEWRLVDVLVGGNGNGVRTGWFTYEETNYSVSLKREGNNWNPTWTATSDPVSTLAGPPAEPTVVPMYLLVLYESSGAGYVRATPSPYRAGTAASPDASLPAELPQPITDSCHASLNPGTTGRLSGG